MPTLFDPFPLRNLTLVNRLGVAPMCQYSAGIDGAPTPWHQVHLGAFAQGGFGLILTEATAVCPGGRISAHDVGLWNDRQAEAWKSVTGFVHTQTRRLPDGTEVPVRIGVQLAHAGRKASVYQGFPGQPRGSVPLDQGGWQTLGPSAVAFDGYRPPLAMDIEQIDEVVDQFAAAAQRAEQAGFDIVEIHAAHGYLLHEFLSPLSNQRTDEYGGNFENRARLLLRVVDAIRPVWQGPLFVRISGTDWVPGGWTGDDSVELARLLKQHQVDLVDVSSGGNQQARVPLAQGHQVEFADRVRNEAGIAASAVGLIVDPDYAEAVVEQGRADVVLIARAALREPHWPQRAAHELGFTDFAALYPPQYERGDWALT